MNNSTRWAIRIVVLMVAAIVYGVWRKVDADLGLGVGSALLRGVVVFGGLIAVWVATGSQTKNN